MWQSSNVLSSYVLYSLSQYYNSLLNPQALMNSLIKSFVRLCPCYAWWAGFNILHVEHLVSHQEADRSAKSNPGPRSSARFSKAERNFTSFFSTVYVAFFVDSVILGASAAVGVGSLSTCVTFVTSVILDSRAGICFVVLHTDRK